MIKFVLLCLLIIVALALLAGPGVRRIMARLLGIPRR